MPSKADVKAWKAQLVAQAEQQILKLTDSDRFKQYLRTCLDTLTFDLILVKLDQKQEFLIHEKLCTPL
ncbi:hypothetical protein [Lactobacillus sp. JM1]|uniref:hypothetical protein n=1 Tax=Lactobacillus sp. JM1 TaxID=2690380 RepID=UPI001316D4EF|nr:hypothetical protein [Lactobacillus sp. JM1]QHC54157.1 hypothetical protein F3I00_10415 [Lactobacillus sp. JM1]